MYSKSRTTSLSIHAVTVRPSLHKKTFTFSHRSTLLTISASYSHTTSKMPPTRKTTMSATMSNFLSAVMHKNDRLAAPTRNGGPLKMQTQYSASSPFLSSTSLHGKCHFALFVGSGGKRCSLIFCRQSCHRHWILSNDGCGYCKVPRGTWRQRGRELCD